MSDHTTKPNYAFIKYTSAVLLPFLLAPIAEIKTGQAAPTPIPRTIGNALANVNNPVTDNACSTPTVADALCNTAVNKIPTKIPANGFENIVSISTNTGLSFNGATAPLMVCIPVIKIENPNMILPRFLCTVLLPNIRRIIPITATTAEIVAVDKRLATPLEP